MGLRVHAGPPHRGGCRPGPRSTRSEETGGGQAPWSPFLSLSSSFSGPEQEACARRGASVRSLGSGLGWRADTTKGRAAPGSAPPLRAPAPGGRTWRLPRGSQSLEVGSGVGAGGSDVTARPRAPMSASQAGAQVRGEARGQAAGAGRRDRAARGSAAGFPGECRASPAARRGGDGGGGRAAEQPMRRWVWRCGLRAEAGLREWRRPGSLQRVGEDADPPRGRSCPGSARGARTLRKSHSTTTPTPTPIPLSPFGRETAGESDPSRSGSRCPPACVLSPPSPTANPTGKVGKCAGRRPSVLPASQRSRSPATPRDSAAPCGRQACASLLWRLGSQLEAQVRGPTARRSPIPSAANIPHFLSAQSESFWETWVPLGTGKAVGLPQMTAQPELV